MEKKYAYVLLLVSAVLLVGYFGRQAYNGGSDGGKIYADPQNIRQTNGDAKQTALNYNALGFKILSSNEDMTISPNMLASNIGLYAEGAVDEGRSQAEDMLGANENLKENHAALVNALIGSENPSFDYFFSGLFMDKKINPNEEFVDANFYYGTYFETADFFDFVAVKDKINELASIRTEGNITEVVKEIYPKSSMVFASALKVKEYFADEVGAVKRTTKSFMNNQTEYFEMANAKVNIYQDEKIIFLRIPLENDYSYEVVMSRSGDLTGLTLADIKGFRDKAKEENVALSLPVPRAEANMELKEALKKSGFDAPFNSTTLLTNLSRSNNLKVDKMDQYISFELMPKENITATDIASEKTVVIDKSYYYMFVHERTGCNTIMGKKTK